MRGRVFQMTIEEARDKPDVVLGTFTLNSLPIRVVFDLGATFSFVSSQFVEKLNIPLAPLYKNITVDMINGSWILVKDQYLDCRF